MINVIYLFVTLWVKHFNLYLTRTWAPAREVEGSSPPAPTKFVCSDFSSHCIFLRILWIDTDDYSLLDGENYLRDFLVSYPDRDQSITIGITVKNTIEQIVSLLVRHPFLKSINKTIQAIPWSSPSKGHISEQKQSAYRSCVLYPNGLASKNLSSNIHLNLTSCQLSWLSKQIALSVFWVSNNTVPTQRKSMSWASYQKHIDAELVKRSLIKHKNGWGNKISSIYKSKH